MTKYTESIKINANKTDKEKQLLLSQFNLNLETGRYDYVGNLDYSILKYFVSEDRDGFTINFGIVTGTFNCSSLGLTSLKGAPTEVGESFYCASNQLTSLEGAPTEVGGEFWCSYNELTSLKGAPREVGGTFFCYGNKLTSLEGAPQKVGGDFWCSYNELTSLKGAPKTVGGDFDCSYNPNLHSLEGIGEVKGDIYKDF